MSLIHAPLTRRLLILTCAFAAIPVLWKAPEVAAEIRNERAAGAVYRHGLHLQAAGSLEEAAGEFRRVLVLVPGASAPLISLAETEVRRGRFDEAAQLYRRILEVYPYGYIGSLRRDAGVAELRRGRLEEAREELRRAVEYDPADWFAPYVLGEVARRLGDKEEARASWARALHLNPEFRPARLRLQQLNESR